MQCGNGDTYRATLGEVAENSSTVAVLSGECQLANSIDEVTAATWRDLVQVRHKL